jgi:hypothetical protein
MWLQMPKGCEAVNIERQDFRTEYKDTEGFSYFRVPDHFAPKILGMGMGFKALTEAPAGATLDDLPKADPLRDGAIAELTGTVSAMQVNLQNMQTDLGVANAKAVAAAQTIANLEQQLLVKSQRITELEEAIEDKGLDLPAKKAK